MNCNKIFLFFLLCLTLKSVAQPVKLTEADKKTFIKNFQTVLQHIPGKFEKLKTGEEDWDITNRISWFKSNLQLFPAYSNKDKTQLMYGTYTGKPMIAFIETAPVDVNTIVNILLPVLKQKGMAEVNTKLVIDDPTARSFRRKDAVLQINSVATGGSTLSIGKIPYYYESDVKPITVTKPKPAPIAPKNNIIELKQAILKANEAVKNNKSSPFSILASTKKGRNFLFIDANETVWQVKNIFNTVVSDTEEICIQTEPASEEIAAKMAINPCRQLKNVLGPGLKIIYDTEDTYMANFENISISYAIMEGPGGMYAPFIFIRPANKQSKFENENIISESRIPERYITPTAFANIIEAVCKRNVHLKVGERIEENKIYVTSFAKNGKQKNLPVYYKQTLSNFFTTIIGLSDNIYDFEDAVTYINSLFSITSTCSSADRKLKLTYNKDSQNYYDVYASKDGGIFAYVEKEKVNGKDIVQLRITNYIYTAGDREKVESSSLASCSELELILKECIADYKSVKGSFVKKETPAEYFNTTLPSLGFKDKFVVQSKNIDIVNGNVASKNVIYYSAEQKYTNSTDALNMYQKMEGLIKKCFSGAANITDDKNQKIYELITNYNGHQIRVVLIYLNFFSSSVSVCVKLAD